MRFPGSKYPYLKIPFGAAIDYLASRTTNEGKERTKLVPRLTDGILLGYELQWGGRFRGKYIVAPIDGVPRLPAELPSEVARQGV